MFFFCVLKEVYYYLFQNKPTIVSLSGGLIMDDEKKWLLMTYYCPIHGDSGIVRPIELTKKEIRETVLKKAKTTKK